MAKKGTGAMCPPTSKDCLLIQGLDINGHHVDLHEPGQGVTKVHIEDAPFSVPNDFLKSWISQYGTVIDCRNEHTVIDGRRTRWRSGTRMAFVTSLNVAIPPVVKLNFNGKDFNVSVWHYGQTHTKCRWCHNIVEKAHECDKRPIRRCHNCGKRDHIKADCPVGRVCYLCGDKDHIARECPQQSQNSQKEDLATLPTRGIAGQHPHSPEGTLRTTIHEAPVESHESPTEDTPGVGSAEPLEGHSSEDMETENCNDSQMVSPDQTQSSDTKNDALMRTILIGTSNCRGLKLCGDDSMVVENELLSQGGLSIGEAHEKLEEISSEQLKQCDGVIIHVGSCDFPVRSEKEMDENYTNYVELLDHVSKRCPQAHILISSILPRGGNGREVVNGQIHKFNNKLSQLSHSEDRLEFVDNDTHFLSNTEVIKGLFKSRDATGIHVNDAGKARLEVSLLQALKEICFKRKLENEWSIS